MRILTKTTITLLTLSVAASAATFAGFTITPKGSQKLNVQTGTTVLEQGGSATDAKNGLTVAGNYIEYKDGDFLKARVATLSTSSGGKMTADTADYNAKTGDLVANGHLNYNDNRIKGLTADTATIQSKVGMVVAKGNVKSQNPSMSANTVVVDYKNSRAVMYGNYRYNYGGTSLSSIKNTATLFVSWDAQGKASATTKPSPAQLAAFQAFLK